ncbi:MAG: DUF4406 domain-containing protein [Raoultibacter sp.]
MKIYIAGPVTGMPDNNLPAFQAAAKELEAAGYEAIVPHDSIHADAKWRDAMRIAIAQMMQADGVALLGGWVDSEGARIEYNIANQVDIPTHTVDQWVTLAVEGLL